MNKNTIRFQVLFEEPFWIGIFERMEDGKLSVSRVVFGPEPKDYELLHYLVTNFYDLRFSPEIEAESKIKEHTNPKRMQREVKKQLSSTSIGTKSQQALKLQQEQGKEARKLNSRERKEEKEMYLFELKQQKRKEKHKGR